MFSCVMFEGKIMQSLNNHIHRVQKFNQNIGRWVGYER